MAYQELEQHRILPRTLIDYYFQGYKDKAFEHGLNNGGEPTCPEKLLAETAYFSKSPHMLANWILKKWYDEGYRASIDNSCEPTTTITNKLEG